MEQTQLIRITTMLEQALGAQPLNDAARNAGFLHRLRLITPQRLAISLLGTLATQEVQSLADLHRGFVATTGISITYKPFYKQLFKPAFTAFMKAVFARLVSHLGLEVLVTLPDSPLAEFDDIYAHDSTEFKIPDWFQDRFPGRFAKRTPAAVALHTSLSLRQDQPVHIELASQCTAARDHRPPAETLRGKLFLGDRAYADCLYVHEVARAGGSCLIRTPKSINPQVLAGWIGTQRWRAEDGPKCRQVLAGAAGKTLDLDVEFARSARRPEVVRVRLVAVWNPQTGQHVLLLTNLPRGRFTAAFLGEVYRLRWQVELLFKEWKSYANLHAFRTEQEGIATGLIWAAVAAAFLKRFCAHATAQVYPGTSLSTRKVAMAVTLHLGGLLAALVRGGGVRPALRRLLCYLRDQGRRSNLKRENATGRGRTGLRPKAAPDLPQTNCFSRSCGALEPVAA